MRTVSPLVVLAALLAGVIGVVTAGCPDRECEHLTDCPTGQLCNSSGECVEDTTQLIQDAGPHDGGVVPRDAGPGNDGGTSENLRVPRVEQLNAPVTAIAQDPADANIALVATWTVGGSLDEIGDLALDTHQIAGSPRYDFANIAGGCDIDELHFFADQGALQLPRGDELWFSCVTGGGALIRYADLAFAQSYRDPLLDNIDLAAFVDSGDDTNGDARVVFAERGGTELKVVRFEPTDQQLAPRGLETVGSDVECDAIAGIFTVVEGHDQLGDVVLVFDRGAAGTLPRLVPVQRNYGELTWHGPPILNSQLETITLPAGTHGALFRADPGIPDVRQLTTSNADDDVPNVLITLPTDGAGGTALFFRYERENGRDLDASGPVSGFPEVQLGGASIPSTLPAAEDQLMLVETDFGGVEFAYVLSNAAIGFSIPLPAAQNDDVTNDVRRGAFESIADRPIAMLPVSATRLLIGFANKNEVHQVGFSAQF